jgi:TP901 family phage tail tape measure protein
MSDTRVIATEVRASATGFEQTQAAIRALMDNSDKTAKTITAAFSGMPKQIEKAFADSATAIINSLKKPAETEKDEAAKLAAAIKQTRQQLNDETNRLTLSGVEYRIQQAEKERNAVVVRLRQMLTDEQEFQRLREQAYRNAEIKITAIQREEAAKRKAEAASQATARAGAGAAGAAVVGGAAGMAGAGLLADLGKSASVAMEFDKNMRNVDSIAHLTQDQFKAMSNAVLEMTKEIPKSAADLSSGLYDIQSSGFAGQQALDVLKVSAQGATAGLSTTAESAKTLTGLMNAYNLKEGPDATRIMNSLFQTIADGVTTMPELAAHIGMVATNAANSGVDIEHLGAALAVLTVNGLSTATSVQSFNGMLDQMKKPVKEAAEYAQTLTDANGKQTLSWFKAGEAAKHISEVGIDKALKEIAAATGGNTDALSKLLPEQESYRAALILTKNNGEQYRDFLVNQAKDATALSEALARQGESYANMAALAENAANRVRIAFGSAFLGALSPVSVVLIKISNAFTSLPAPIQHAAGLMEVLAAGVGLAIGGLSALGFALFGLSKIPAALSAIMSLFPKFAASSGLMADIAGGAFRLLVGFMGELSIAAGILYTLWSVNFLGIKDITDSIMSTIHGNSATFWESIRDGWRDLVKDVSSITAWLFDFLTTIFGNGLAAIEQTIIGFTQGMGELFGLFYSWLENSNSVSLENVQSNWLRALGSILKFAGTAMTEMAAIIRNGLSKVVDVFQSLAAAMTDPLHMGQHIDLLKRDLADLSADSAKHLGNIGSAAIKMETTVTAAFNAAGLSMAARGQQIKGGLGALAGVIPGMGSPGQTTLQPPMIPSTRGIKLIQGGIYTPRDLKHDIKEIEDKRKAGHLSHEEAIQDLKKLETAHNLTGQQRIEVEKRIALEVKAAQAEGRKGDAAAKRAAHAAEAAARKEAAAERKEERAEIKAENEAESKELEALLTKYKQMASENYNIKKHFNDLEIAYLLRMAQTATDTTRVKIQKEIDLLRERNAAIKVEQEKAQRGINREVAGSVASARGETYKDKVNAINQKYDDKVNDAKAKGLDGSGFDLARNAEIQKLREDSERSAQEKLDSIQEAGYAKKKEKIEAEYKELIRLAQGEHRSTETLEKARLDDLAKLEKEEAEKAEDNLAESIGASATRARAKLADEWDKKIALQKDGQNRLNDVIAKNNALDAFDKEQADKRQEKLAAFFEAAAKVGDTLADKTKTGFQKFSDITGQIFDSLKAQVISKVLPLILDTVTPAFAIMFTTITTEGLASFGMLIGGWAIAGAISLVAGAQMAAGWLLALGPIGWVAGAIAGVIALIGLAVASTQALTGIGLPTQREVDKSDASATRDKALKSHKETNNAIADLEQELLDRVNKKEINLTEAKAIYAARSTEIYQKSYDDQLAILEESWHLRNQTEQDQALAAGDTARARDLKRQADIHDVYVQTAKYITENLMSREDAERQSAAKITLINRAALAGDIADREKANADLAAMQKETLSTINQTKQNTLDSKLATGQITKSQYDKGTGDLSGAAAMQDMEAQKKLIADYMANANDERLTDKERQEWRVKATTAMAAAEKALNTGMKTELESYKSSVNDFYSQKAEQMDAEKQAITDRMNLATRAYEVELQQTEKLISAKEAEIQAIDAKQKLLDDQAKLAKDNYESNNIGTFNDAINSAKFGPDTGIYAKQELGGMGLNTGRRVTLGADDLTFAGLDDQKKKVEDLFALKQLTQTEEANQLIAIASKKGALAKKESQDTRLVFTQQIAATGFLKQAFDEFNEAQNKLIDGASAQITKQNTQARDAAQITLDSLTAQKTQTALAITGIQSSYTTLFSDLSTKYLSNKTAWDSSMKLIIDGMDPQINAIVSKYRPLENELNNIIYLQSRAGVASYSGNPFSAAAVASYGIKNTPVTNEVTGRGFAKGGTVTGGTPGRDSVPAMLMPGEEVLNDGHGLGARLNRFLAGQNQYGATPGGGVQNNQRYVSIAINNPSVRNDEDIPAIARAVSAQLSRWI